ncbi:hypothetical protein J7H97_004586 [Vibrio parahaemolyticus]|nr:hypothetical protein [Vibrio parahaemolyticus]MDG2804796.1 hypothetical protein [Vibrio parahaemolyticus]MDG3027255.1 hypothetical protein [Vibrio parahaemolyticus]HCG7776360.1 hypothetical protein [Vibrio parahaemolyticus]
MLLGKEFNVFFIAGCLLNIVVFIFFGYDGTLPDGFRNALSEPISYIWFLTLSGLSYLLWACITAFGSKAIPEGSNREILSSKIIEPLVEVVINVGKPILGYVSGSALPAFVFFIVGWTSLDAFSSLFLMALLLVLILFNLNLIKNALVSGNFHFLYLACVFSLYLVTGVSLRFFSTDQTMKASGAICLIVAVLQFLTLFVNTVMHPDSITKRLRQIRNAWHF